MRRLFVTTFAALLALSGCATPAQVAAPSTVPGMVSAADPRAAAAGAEILRAGGSAADAALATLVALTVVEPQSSGIGGGGFLVYADADGLDSYDGRETAPAAATGTWFFKDGKPMDFEDAVPGGRSVGVPGNVRLMALAHQDQGRLPWAQLFGPAIRLARDGFQITPSLHRMLGYVPQIGGLTPAGRALYYDAQGKPLPVGTLVRNPAMAAFLEQLAAAGPDAFYVGPNARAIVAAVSGAPRNPAPMTVGDLASYDSKRRPPVCGDYRGHRICGIGPPSSGGTTVLAIVKQLERFDMRGLGPDSPTSWHLIAESMRLAFADRDRYLGDGDFVPVPVAGLIEPDYLAGRSAMIAPEKTLANVAAGTPRGAPRVTAGLGAGGKRHLAFRRGRPLGRGRDSDLDDREHLRLGPQRERILPQQRAHRFQLRPGQGRDAGRQPGRGRQAAAKLDEPDHRLRSRRQGSAGGWRGRRADDHRPGRQGDRRRRRLEPDRAAGARLAGDLRARRHGVRRERHQPRSADPGAAKRSATPGSSARPPSFKANAIEWSGGRWVGAADPRSEGTAVSE